MVGHTKGRGRQDRHNGSTKGLPAIYVYALAPGFRRRMGLDRNEGRGALSVSDGVVGETWAQVPDRAFSGVGEGQCAKVKAYYRLIDEPEESAVTMSGILAAHRERTVRP